MTPKYRYDKLQFSTVIPNYIDVEPLTTSIPCSGTYANGSGANFTGTVTLSSLTNFYDIYLINQNTNHKVAITDTLDVTLIWQYTTTESITDLVTAVGFALSVTITLFNGTGGSLTITNQTYTLEVIQYQIANFTV